MIGPYFTLGFIAKGVEVVLIALPIADILRVYGSVPGALGAARAAVFRPAPDPTPHGYSSPLAWRAGWS